MKYDLRIFTTQTVCIKLYSDYWVPIRFTSPKTKKEYLVNPIHHVNRAERTYASCFYAVIKSDTSHILITNPTPRSVKLGSDSVIGTFEPFKGNIHYSFLNWETPSPKTVAKNLSLGILPA